jgi:tight adherence protein C
MQWLYDIARSLGTDAASVQLIVMALAGLTVTVLALGIAFISLGVADPMRRRLTHFHGSEKLEGGRRVFSIDTMLGPVTQYVLPSEELERSRVIAKLSYAGYRSPNALQTFYAIKALLAVGLPLAAWGDDAPLPATVHGGAAVLHVRCRRHRLLGPSIVLDKLVARRLKRLRDGFPDALDLLVVCVESGLGLTQALQRVADELTVSHAELAMELAIVNAEIRSGVDRVMALKNLAERTGLDDIKGLVSLLVQTLRFGTGVADALRIYAEEFRDKRMQRAEEQAAKMGTKMVFPLILFLFPGFFVVAIGPAVLRLIEAFGHF